MQPESIPVSINGEPKLITANQTVAGLLNTLNLPADRIAVEMDKVLVRKRDWTIVTVAPGARIEIVEFVGGG